MPSDFEAQLEGLTALFKTALSASPCGQSKELTKNILRHFDEVVGRLKSGAQHTPFSSLTSGHIQAMGYKTKKLIMNREDIRRLAQSTTEPDSSMIAQFRKLHLATNISDPNASEALRRMLVDMILIEALSPLNPEDEPRKDEVQIVVVPEHPLFDRDVVATDEKGTDYTIGGRPDYVYFNMVSQDKPTDEELADKERISEFKRPVRIGTIEVKPADKFGKPEHKAEGGGHAIYTSKVLLEVDEKNNDAKAVRYILTEGYKWKFCILDRKKRILYVQSDYLELNILRDAHGKGCQSTAQWPHPLDSPCMGQAFTQLTEIICVLREWLSDPHVLRDYRNCKLFFRLEEDPSK